MTYEECRQRLLEEFEDGSNEKVFFQRTLDVLAELSLSHDESMGLAIMRLLEIGIVVLADGVVLAGAQPIHIAGVRHLAWIPATLFSDVNTNAYWWMERYLGAGDQPQTKAAQSILIESLGSSSSVSVVKERAKSSGRQ